MKVYKHRAEMNSRTLDSRPKASSQASISAVLQTANFAVQRKPEPVDADQTGTGALYKDNVTDVAFTKVKDDWFLLDENILICWNGTGYVKRDGAAYDLSTRVLPTEKVLAVGMSEYARLGNDSQAYTHLQTTEACPCFILILRSNTETALYHITINNNFTENDFLEFIGCPKDEYDEYDILKVTPQFIEQKGITAHMYQGAYEPDMQAKADEYLGKTGLQQAYYLSSLDKTKHEDEYVQQAKKYKDVKGMLGSWGITLTEGKMDSAKIRLSDGTVSHPAPADVSADLGRLVVERGKIAGNDSKDFIRRTANVDPGDNYQGI